MTKTKVVMFFLALCVVGKLAVAQSATTQDAVWIRPDASSGALPVWGHADGLRVGLWPMPGPRGLLRVYAPYLGHAETRMINYIAVEPIIAGQSERSFSELEISQLDHVPGLRMWSTDSLDSALHPSTHPAPGIVSHDGTVQVLTVFIRVEPFRSGAHVALRLRFRADRPHEVTIATFLQPDSTPLRTCILSATMGNFAQLRVLSLRDHSVAAGDLWPGYSESGFTSRVCFPKEDLLVAENGDVLFLARPARSAVSDAAYAKGTPMAWRYSGESAVQFWRCAGNLGPLWGCVNGRAVYWDTHSPIPGGVSFENMELILPFRDGQEIEFSVVPLDGGV